MPCAPSWVVHISESTFFKGHLTPPVSTVYNVPGILAHGTSASLFLAVLGKNIGPACSSLMLVSRPSKGNHHGAVPGDVATYVARRRPGKYLLVQEILTHLGMSVNSASLEKSLWASALPCLLLQRDRKSLFLGVLTAQLKHVTLCASLVTGQTLTLVSRNAVLVQPKVRLCPWSLGQAHPWQIPVSF